MNRPSQLARLILDFYRENPIEWQQLKPLETCQLFRWWGVLYIRCPDEDTAMAAIEGHLWLEEPILQLRLARQVRILVGRQLWAAFSIDKNSSPTDVRRQVSRE
ncbi:MAG: hypothetical protein WBB29_19930 [Geitlerinemataceae cyanobacterium]